MYGKIVFNDVQDPALKKYNSKLAFNVWNILAWVRNNLIACNLIINHNNIVINL